MQVLYISEGPRKDGNTDWLLKTFLSELARLPEST